MPVDNLGQTFRFIVEQAGGGGGSGGGGGGGSTAGGGAAAHSTRQAQDMRRMMDKMVKAVDTTEKTTANAFQQGFKKLGLQLTFANMLKQSQIFTGTLNAIFQVIGALIDITLAPFMPLIVKFLQKAIPRLLEFAERMAQWVRGELAQLDELGFMGYIKKKLDEDIPEAFERFGPVVAGALGSITELVVKQIPSIAAIAIKAMGELTAVVVGSAISEVGQLMMLAIGNVVKMVMNGISGVMRAMSETEVNLGGQTFMPFKAMAGWAEGLDKAAEDARSGMERLGEKLFVPLGEWAENSIRTLMNATAEIVDSEAVHNAFDAIAESMGTLVETATLGAIDGLVIAGEGLSTALDNIVAALPEAPTDTRYPPTDVGTGEKMDVASATHAAAATEKKVNALLAKIDEEYDPFNQGSVSGAFTETMKPMKDFAEAFKNFSGGAFDEIGEMTGTKKKPNIPYFGNADWGEVADYFGYRGGGGGGMPSMGGQWSDADTRSLWGKTQDIDVVPGSGTWNPLKGWDLSPDNPTIQKGMQGFMAFFSEMGKADMMMMSPQPAGIDQPIDITLLIDGVKNDVPKVADLKTDDTRKHKISADLGHAKWEEETWDWG